LGATPETLARALFRSVAPLRPPCVRQPVVCDQVTVEEVAATAIILAAWDLWEQSAHL